MTPSQPNTPIRDLDHIRETPPADSSDRWVTFALLIASGACLVFAGMAFGPRLKSSSASKKLDPLGELATRSTTATLQPNEVTFPSILSDKTNPTTPLIATYTAPRALATTVPSATTLLTPNDPERLPIASIPTKPSGTINHGLYRSRNWQQEDTSESAGNTKRVAAGHSGGWQVQVASSPAREDAEAIATRLRARGHRAYVQQVQIPKRGTWYRVRIGPFSKQQEAIRYHRDIEAREHLAGLVLKSDSEERESKKTSSRMMDE